MWFWNRVEIYKGYSLKEFSELKNSLAAANIKYDYKLNDRKSPGLNLVDSYYRGHLTAEPKVSVEYTLFVHHKDYAEAMYLTSNRHIR